jgi:hypothetical protein
VSDADAGRRRQQKIAIQFPKHDQLSLVGEVRMMIRLSPRATELTVDLDGEDVTSLFERQGGVARGNVPVATEGEHHLSASALFDGTSRTVDRLFETVELLAPDECEVLNDAQCLLPYPSSRFLVPDATPTGLRVQIPAAGLPAVNGDPLDPTPYTRLDGFSPTVQILMHFPSGVDLEQSNVSRLLPPGPVPVSPPYIDTRTHDDTSLRPDSATILMHAETGERILHFVELDRRADGGPARQALILRPAVALAPGERYIVAVRDLVDPGGAPVEPEPPFAVLRDRRFTTIDAIEGRKAYYSASIFAPLARAGVEREDLVLAFDFIVRSDEGLTAQMISMRDQAFASLGERWNLGEQTFAVTGVSGSSSCFSPFGTWRTVSGTYEVPLFLSSDPEPPTNNTPGTLNVDGAGSPVPNGVTNAKFTIRIPCAALHGPTPSLMVGHGLFESSSGVIDFERFTLGLDYIAGATNWRGLSSDDFFWVGLGVIGPGISQLNNFPAFTARLKQGQLNTLVLARMMKEGIFNRDPAFQNASVGVFPGSGTDAYYYGISLGGIMGTMFAALTPDVERFNIDVGAMNFSLLLQRSTQFGAFCGGFPPCFEDLVQGIGLTDPMETLLVYHLWHELWVSSEPAGFVHRLRDEVEAGDKQILMTVAWLDKQVSNQASEILARTLGLPNLVGSVQQELTDIPDVAGPQDSALVIYDTGYFDLFDPTQQGSIPPLSNEIPSVKCDPHGVRVSIPASLDQLEVFLQPGGAIENFCSGICDGAASSERPLNLPTCDPRPCSHDICTEGSLLELTCESPPATSGSSCIVEICTVDPFCCENSWDNLCVGEVSSVCGLSCPIPF